MPATQQHATEIVAKVKSRLADAANDGIHLEVRDHRVDDEWLYIVVVPSKPGVRASDYANFMSRIERELRAGGDDYVLLVPALDD